MAGFDAHKNLAVSAVVTAPTPATSGTSLTVTGGEGVRFPAAPFNATVWPANAMPTPLNGEVIRVTARATDTLTITRAQEGSTARAIGTGDLIAATITAKTLTDLETRAALKDETNTFTANQRVQSAVPRLQWIDTAQPVNSRHFEAIGFQQELQFTALNDAETVAAGTPLALTRTGDIKVGRNIHERLRVTPLGHGIAFATVATSGEGAALGGNMNFQYALVGQMLFWRLYCLSMSVPAATGYLRFTIPAGHPPQFPGLDLAALRVYSAGDRFGWAEAHVGYLHVYFDTATQFQPGVAHVIGQGFYFTTT